MAGHSRAGVPIVLPTVRIQANVDGALAVTVDREPYAVPPGFRRDQVRGLLRDLAAKLGPIRVEITESNGEKYIDIQTPSGYDPAPLASPHAPPPTPGVRGHFDAGEDVMVAVVVARRTAATDGTVAVRLPPSLLQRYGDDLLLIGRTTKVPATFVDEDLGERS